MNNLLIKKYSIEFTNRIIQKGEFGKQIDKFPSLNNKDLTTFLYEWNAREINNYLLPDIENVLNGIVNEAQNGSETISILIYYDHVQFYPDNSATFSIPTLEFKEIIEGWREFLLQPPLNGTQI